ncbi:MAG: transglycosylase domain-containing protein, partial [Myxococcota bacterium]
VGCLGSMGMIGLGGAAIVAVIGVLFAVGGYFYYSKDLPTVENLRAYKPPTVTVVSDVNGKVLGEIFEEKRYVVPIEEIPDHVKNAFLAAEDANFYGHGGIDYMGIVRAVGRNALAGRSAQGASTITQQVARNFLLTRDKTIVRKVKEVLLSWRIEEAYTKDHILFLYLNEIFLGAQSYGVEAASRTYFDKSVREVSIAEAAILAGLPQRPSDYSPYKGWDKARARQEYVVNQMLSKGFITQAQHDEALAEDVKIAAKENKFRSKAPWFTEHVRRYLVDKYGEQRVLHEGLNVKTTCDLDLQTLAQTAVKDGVYETDWRMGYRRAAAKNIGKGNIKTWREDQEKKLRESWAEDQDPAGRVPVPERSVLEDGKVYEAVIVSVTPKLATLAIGSHDALLPISWNDWIYEPDPTKSWRGRVATDFTAMVDSDGDKKKDNPILMAGDVVKVTVEAQTTKDPKVSKAFAGTPGESGDFVPVKMFQIPEVESALFSMDLATGAVRTMIGGSDFDKSEFNRAVQARRQVGSTFKPIVYAAAVESKRVTTATVIADAPLAMATADEFVWKPSNYSNDYEGNMTMRTALQKSKNTCTVRILEAADPGMNDDVVYKFARRLGIGGTPTYRLPADWVASPKNDVLCPWVKETRGSTICMDRNPPKDAALSDAEHRAKLTPESEYWCRACDMSMGLGSASLTMEEMVRAYSAFATGGKLIEPYYVEEVADRDGNVLEKHEIPTPPQVMDPAVASIATWLLKGVVQGGTASDAGRELKLIGLAGKTGTTNDEKDAWFVGFTNDVITAVWFGFDQPQTLGVSSTGGRTALPVWIKYMKVAAPREKDRDFPVRGDVQYAMIDEATGRRVTSGGVSYPFLPGTVPEGTGLAAGQVSIEDLSNL